jgi:site-specific recombinase XerD
MVTYLTRLITIRYSQNIILTSPANNGRSKAHYGHKFKITPGSGQYVFVNLFRGTVGAPMRLDAVNDLVGAAARRAGIDPPPRPHQLRHAFASNVLDAGGTLDEAQDLLGHVSISSTQVYTHPDPARLRAAVDAVPSPRDLAGAQA